MKKSILVAIFLATLTLTATPARAQTVDNSAQIEELKSTLIALLTQMIQALQTQIQAEIARTNQAVAEVTTRVTAVENAPAVVTPTPAPTPASITLGNPSCVTPKMLDPNTPDIAYFGEMPSKYPLVQMVAVPFVATGNWNNASFTYQRLPVTSQHNGVSFMATDGDRQKEVDIVANPRSSFAIQAYPGTYDISVKVDGIDLGTQQVIISACQ